MTTPVVKLEALDLDESLRLGNQEMQLLTFVVPSVLSKSRNQGMQLLESVVDLVREYILETLNFNVMSRLKNQEI